MMPRLRIFRDAVHGYIAVTNLEFETLNHPLFLRLHYVTQNALAYLTYPSNRTSRFSHSIGTMDVAGRMLLAALANSRERERRRFLDAARELIESLLTPLFAKFDDLKDDVEWLYSGDAFYRHCGLDKNDVSEIVTLQALRMSCLVHDLGHPPYSHTTEAVLEQYLTTDLPDNAMSARFFAAYQAMATRSLEAVSGADVRERQLRGARYHELAGQALMWGVFRDILRGSKVEKFAQLCLRIGTLVLLNHTRARGAPAKLLCALHGLVSGQVDADRADYVCRDGAACGFAFGYSELDRIVGSMRVSLRNNRIRVLPSTLALSSVEEFFTERYRIYKWIVFHHSVVRADVALTRALSILFEILVDKLEIPSDTKRPLFNLLETGGLSQLWTSLECDDKFRGYCGCDEPWLFNLLRSVCESEALKPLALAPPLALLKVSLQMIHTRNKRNFLPFWKRLEQYREFACSLQQAACEARRRFSNLTKDETRLRGLRERCKCIDRPLQFANEFLRTALDQSIETCGNYPTLRVLEKAVHQGFRGILVLHYNPGFEPYGPFQLLDAARGHAVIPMENISTVPESLQTAWANDIQLRAFLVPGEYTGSGKFRIWEDRKWQEVSGMERKLLGKNLAAILLDGKWRRSLSPTALP